MPSRPAAVLPTCGVSGGTDDMQPMNLDQKLHQKMYREIWQQYCGFLDLSLSEYMAIQERLMLEQIAL